MITPTEIAHLKQLLEQDEAWVPRGRWVRWLRHGEPSDTVPISGMLHDDRVAARSWLRQQQHALHDTVHGGARAPQDWVTSLPLYAGLLED